MGFRILIPLLLVQTLVGCGWPDAPDLSDPVSSAKGFLDAANRFDCERMWRYLSAETREAARIRGERQIRDGAYYANTFSPKRYHCKSSTFHALPAEHVEALSQDGDRARVRAVRLVDKDFLIPGFFPTSHERVSTTLDLVRENGEWRMALGGKPTPERGWQETVVDGVTVRTRDGNAAWRVWALADVDATPAEIQGAVMDWSGWMRWLPELRDVRRLGVEALPEKPAARDDDDPWPLTRRWFVKRINHWFAERWSLSDLAMPAPTPDAFLRVQLAAPAASGRWVTTFGFRRYLAAGELGPGFAAGVLSPPDSLPPPNPGEGEPLSVEQLSVAAYPDVDGGTRLMVTLGLRVDLGVREILYIGQHRLREAGHAPALPPPAPERLARAMRALEREARARSERDASD